MTERNNFFTIKEHGGKQWENLSAVQKAIFQHLTRNLIKVLQSMENEGDISLSGDNHNTDAEDQGNGEVDSG
jgi:hypothetical protein